MPSPARAPTALLAVVPIAGCLGPCRDADRVAHARAVAVARSRGSDDDRDAAEPGDTDDRPEPSHPVTARNARNRSVEVRVTVVREAAGRTVHDEAYDLVVGSERTVYDTAEAEPEGVDAFAVTVRAVNATESVTVEGELFVTCAIC